MEESTAQRLIAVAEKVGDDIGWTVEVRTPGINIRYMWRAENGLFYTVENFTGWGAVEYAGVNPLLIAVDDLIKQKKEFKL